MRPPARSRPPLISLILLALTAWAAAPPASGGEPKRPRIVGEHLQGVVLESPHPYPPGDRGGKPVWVDRFTHPGARYLVLRFEMLDLAPGDRVEIRDGDGKVVVAYRGKGAGGKRGGFITPMIPGDEASIELFATDPGAGHYGYRIDRVTRGFTTAELEDRYGAEGIETICGVSDMEDAVCYETGFPDVYARSRPVALILMDGLALCSAWVASCEDHLLTANHCTWDFGDFDTQAELDRMEFLFGYEEGICGGDAATVEYSFLGGTFLENDHDLDYTLIQAPAGEHPASTYGWLVFEDRLPVADERIYIAGHAPDGPKQISLFSTDPSDQDNPDGFCEVFSTNVPPCIGGTVPEIDYYCDVEGGGFSGAPVVSLDTNKVLAMHHCAGCPNRGVPALALWDHIQSGPNPLPACSRFEDVGVVRLDAGVYGCSATAGVQVTDGSLRGAGTQVVEAWSTAEPVPEMLFLTETAPGTGVFRGSVGLTAGASTGGDGLLRVAHGGAVTVRYLDADDGQGGSDVPRLDTAAVDCVAPGITGVGLVDVLGIEATVVWTTDEPATTRVWYAEPGYGWTAATVEGLRTDHGVRLVGLAPCTDYLFRVESTDAAGNLAVDDNGGAYHLLTTGVDVQPAYLEDHAEMIRDLRDAESTITVPDTATVVDLDVTVNVTHTYMGDLDLYLQGPNGIEIELSTDNGGAGDGYTETTFDDEAAVSIQAGTAPFTGSFRPEQPLAAFLGMPAAGDWTLRVFDDSEGDTGTLDSWSLHLRYPARPCGPHPVYAGHPLVGDACAPGEPGDADGVWDAGELVSFSLTLGNDGTEPVTGITARVTSMTSGAVVIDDVAAVPDLAPGASSTSLSPFAVRLSDAFPCGAVLDLWVEVAAAQGTWSGGFSQGVGLDDPGGGIALDEDFDTGLPASWTVVNGGSSADTWYGDATTDPLGCASPNPAPPIAVGWAAVDSDCAGPVDMDEALLTPVLDLAAATAASLEFDHYFNRYTSEIASVDLRASTTGGSWITLRSWTADTANPQHESVDLSPYAAGD
ncbi:MAG: proprotein convertase P-domain-containing protein, partial [Acidobacteriota bacterium]